MNDSIKKSIVKARRNDRVVVKTTIDKFQKSERWNDLIKIQKKKTMTNEKMRIFIKRTTKSISNNLLINKTFQNNVAKFVKKFLFEKQIIIQRFMQLKQKIKKKRNRRVAMILEINFNFIQSHQLSKSQLHVVTQQVFFLSFKKRLTITVRRIERIAIFTNEANLIVADVTLKETTLKMKMFMNQIDDFENVLNLKHSYEQKYVINDDFIVADSSFFFSFDRYIIIIEIIDEKSDNDLFNDEERYKQLIRNEKLSENIKMKEEKETLNEKNENWTNENEENENDEKKKNEKTSKKKWLEELRRNRDSIEVFFLN